MAWVRVLVMPIRSCYATDSASMVGKAITLIKAVGDLETQIKQRKKATTNNPFKKAWNLQIDGDLWNIAFLAASKRRADNHTLKKVKGHATTKDILDSKSTIKDKV